MIMIMIFITYGPVQACKKNHGQLLNQPLQTCCSILNADIADIGLAGLTEPRSNKVKTIKFKS